MFIYPYTWSFYTASVLVGIGAAGKETLSNISFYQEKYVFSLFMCPVLCFVFQSCGRRREMFSPSTPLTAPSGETAASSGRCCSSGESSWRNECLVVLHSDFLFYISHLFAAYSLEICTYTAPGTDTIT